MRGGGRVYDDEGREIPGGGKGYRYFGRARELPGVKEMFEAAARKNRPDEEETESGKKLPNYFANTLMLLTSVMGEMRKRMLWLLMSKSVRRRQLRI